MVNPPEGFWEFSTNIVLPGLATGFLLTLELTLFSGVLGIIIGLFVALLGMSTSLWLRTINRVYVTILRGTPLLLQILFIYFALPSLLDIRLDAMPAGLLALSLNAGAYLAEIFRAGIESIDKGQWEAARALGMSHFQSLRRVILPQSIKRLIPPVVNELSALAKDTSLVSTIALSEMLYATQRIGARYLRPWEVYIWAGLGYLFIVLTLSAIANHWEKRLSRG